MTGTDIPLLSVVIPCYNEKQNLPELHRRCRAELPAGTELVFVDDGSTDGSSAWLRALPARDPDSRIILLARNCGQYQAIRCGFDFARGSYIATLDADLQNPPGELVRLLASFTDTVDAVVGRRECRHDAFWRRCASAAISRWASTLTGVRLHDYGCMLRVYRRPVIERIRACPERTTYLNVLLTWLAPNTREVPVAHAAREHGRSRYRLRALIRCAFDIITGFSEPPFYLLLPAGLAAVLAAAALATARIFAGPDVVGWQTVVALLLGGVILGVQGLLGEYLVRIYRETRRRPTVFIAETCNCT